MKPFLFTILLSSLLISSIKSQSWTTQRIDPAGGDFPTISYSPSGDLRVFYNKPGAAPKMYLRKRNNGQTNWGNEIYVFGNHRVTGLYYDVNSDIYLATSGYNSIAINKSTDGGNTWTFEKTYSASDGTEACYLPLFFSKDSDSIRLVYGFMHYNAVVGSYPLVYTAKKKQGSWDVNPTEILDGTTSGRKIAGLYENGNKVCIPNERGVFYSSNNGLTYSLLSYSDPIPDQLKASDACKVNNRIYLVHEYTYGMMGSDQNISFTYSDDDGATWLNPQKLIIQDGVSRYYPKFAVSGSNIVVAWLTDADATGMQGYKKIKYIISNDNGQNWGTEQTLASFGANEKILDDKNVMMDMEEKNGVVSLAYTVKNSLEDSSHVYLSEIDFGVAGNTPSLISTDFNISPNPVKNVLHVDLNNFRQGTEIEIMDLNGKQWISKTIYTSSESEFDVSSLPQGIYFIRISGNASSEVKKFLKE
jgi:hypothetical protein